MGWTADAGARALRAAHPVSTDANARQRVRMLRVRIGFSDINVPSLTGYPRLRCIESCNPQKTDTTQGEAASRYGEAFHAPPDRLLPGVSAQRSRPEVVQFRPDERLPSAGTPRQPQIGLRQDTVSRVLTPLARFAQLAAALRRSAIGMILAGGLASRRTRNRPRR